MKKIVSLNIATMITVLVVFCAVELILLHDNTFIACSISSIIYKAQFYKLKTHLLMLALLPIYIGVVIFGSACLGVLIGSHVQRFLLNRRGPKSPLSLKNQREK
jgi:hypothetical protein